MRQAKQEDVFVGELMKGGSGRLSQLLRVALRRVEAPEGFAERVQARAAKEKTDGLLSARNSAGRFVARRTLCIAITCFSFMVSARGQSHEVIRGTVTAIDDGVLSVKSDAGGDIQVQLGPQAQIQKLPAGSTDIKSGIAATIGDISVADRILVSATSSGSGPAVARVVFVMKAADIELNQAAQQADWQKRGISGLVRSIDTAAKTVTMSAASITETKNVTIRLTGKTQLLRYASDSVKFADAKPSSLASIHVGDQVTARGEKSSDGQTLIADEIVTGSFQNLSGQIIRIDLPNNALTIRDLVTKAVVTVVLTNNTDMRRLSPVMAMRFAARLKEGVQAAAGSPTSGQGRTSKSFSLELTQVLSSMPTVTLAQLKPGDALLIAATTSPEPNHVTAISLLSGVEPILTAPKASSMTLAPWSLSSGNPE